VQWKFRPAVLVGLAVLACQCLEMLFALCVRLAFKEEAATDFSAITSLEKNFSKPSMKSLLKELKNT
jgi:hypothetical protein